MSSKIHGIFLSKQKAADQFMINRGQNTTTVGRILNGGILQSQTNLNQHSFERIRSQPKTGENGTKLMVWSTPPQTSLSRINGQEAIFSERISDHPL